MFKDNAIESLTLSIELFNRPSALARDHAVVMMLAHSFEMLLKAVIFQRRKTVRDKGEQQSHSLKRCISMCVDDFQVVTPNERTLLTALKQDRDAATHDIIVMGEDLLWLHMRAGITLFRRLLRDEFEIALTDILPGRVIPVSAEPPTDLQVLVEQELEAVAELLAPRTRKTAEAKARLLPLLALDGSVTGRSDQPTDAELNRANRALRDGADWKTVLPGLAMLQIARPEPGGNAQEVTLRIDPDPDGAPVRRAKREEEDGALAYRGVNPFEEFSIRLRGLGPQVGISGHEGLALAEALDLKNDDRAYFVEYTDAGNVRYQGFSARALHLARQALERDDFDLKAAVSAYNAKNGRRRVERRDESAGMP